MSYEFTGKHLIDGVWTETSGERFLAYNPATGETTGTGFCQAGTEEADRALNAAAAAFEETYDLPASRRADLLDAIAAQIEALGEVLLITAQAESGLPVQPRLQGERARTCGQLRLFASLLREGSWVDAAIDTADPARQPLPKPDVRRMQRPLGPVVVFDASNFPLAFGPCGGDTASALASGCPVIVKSHPGHPATNELFAVAVLAALQETGLPAGLFALLQGNRNELSGALVRHPLACAVGFTGSLRAGRALFDIAASRPDPIPVYAEMGSVNPLVVLPAALAERGETIAEGLAGSITMGAGQLCTKPGLIFTLSGADGDRFVERLKTKMAETSGFTLLNQSIQSGLQKSREKVTSVSGVTVLLEGEPSGYAGSTASLYEVNSETWRGREALHEEMFGPGALVVRCSSVEDLLATLEHLEGQLTGTLHVGAAEETALVRQAMHVLEVRVGRLLFNGFPTGVEVCHAMVHGGLYPATTAPGTTSVGTLAIHRFARPVCYQNVPDSLLPAALQNGNPLNILRRVNGEATKKPIE